MKIAVFHDSRIGRRSMNQDRLAWAQSDHAVLLVVADGMGGHRHGEVAAQLAVQHLAQTFSSLAVPRLDDPRRFLAEGLQGAHRAINDYAAQRTIPLDDAPRTTCVACILQDGAALWAHVGDSRLYHVRQGHTVTRTIDHSRVQMLLDAGQITPEEALVHPHRNLVFSCLGGDQPPRIDVGAAVRLEAGDILALCSDGAWGPTGERFPAAFALPLERAVPFLLDAAEAAAGPTCDNLTLLALRFDGAGSDPDHAAPTAPLPTRTTVVEAFGSDAALSEAEIGDTVSEIRRRIVTPTTDHTSPGAT